MIKINRYQIVESTQNLAKDYLKNGDKKEAAFLAQGQTSGYGKQGRFFYSPKKTGIYFSVAFPNFNNHEKLNLLTPAVVTALVITLKEFFKNKDFKIKWVNDIYLENKKVGGILTENLQDGLVIGVGININTQFFPKELEQKAIQITHENVSSKIKTQLEEALIKKTAEAVHTYANNEFLMQYRDFSNLLGKEIQLQLGKNVIAGKAIGIDEQARLIVQTQDKEERFSSGEVTKVKI